MGEAGSWTLLWASRQQRAAGGSFADGLFAGGSFAGGVFGLCGQSFVGRGCGAREAPRLRPAAFLASGCAALALNAATLPDPPGEPLYFVVSSFSGA